MSDKLIAVVQDLISHKHEEEWFEFKVNWFEPHELGEYISALSNVATLQDRDCGYFVWGVENNTHKVVGTTFDVHQDVKHEPLKHYLARQVTPDRGVPRITEAYGKDVIRFNENSIVVTVPFDRLGQEVYGDGQVIPPVDVPVNAENVPVGAKNAPVNAENVPVF